MGISTTNGRLHLAANFHWRLRRRCAYMCSCYQDLENIEEELIPLLRLLEAAAKPAVFGHLNTRNIFRKLIWGERPDNSVAYLFACTPYAPSYRLPIGYYASLSSLQPSLAFSLTHLSTFQQPSTIYQNGLTTEEHFPMPLILQNVNPNWPDKIPATF